MKHHSQLLTEDTVHIAYRVKNRHILLSYRYQSIAFLPGIIGHQSRGISRNRMTRHHFVTHKTEGTVGRHITVNQMLNGSQVSYNNRWTACSDKHLMTIGLGLSQGKNRRRGYCVSVETHECSVYIKKEGILSIIHGAKVRFLRHRPNLFTHFLWNRSAVPISPPAQPPSSVLP